MKKLITVALMCAMSVALTGGCNPPEQAPKPLPPGPEKPVKPTPEPEPTPEPDKSALRCVGYLSQWDYACYETLDWSALTHINIAFCNPDSAGKMQNPFSAGDATFNAIIKKAHDNGVKVIASLRDDTTIQGLISTAKGRTDFVTELVAYAKKYKLDGIDSDLERSDPSFWTNYEAFIIELNKACDENNLLLTTAVSTWFSNNITDKTFACFDFINTMSYDLGFANHSKFEDMKAMAEHYRDVRKIPASRIVVGVPFYGYNKNNNDWNDFRTYKQIIAADPAAWDKDESDNYVYNGAPTIEAKSKFGQDYGGIMIWHLAQDAAGDRALLKVIAKNLFATGAAPRPVNN
jgi:GH18 family chitinase